MWKFTFLSPVGENLLTFLQSVGENNFKFQNVYLLLQTSHAKGVSCGVSSPETGGAGPGSRQVEAPLHRDRRLGKGQRGKCKCAVAWGSSLSKPCTPGLGAMVAPDLESPSVSFVLHLKKAFFLKVCLGSVQTCMPGELLMRFRRQVYSFKKSTQFIF